jgi:hypothetical protein
MRRVHNDNGTSVQAAPNTTPPGNGGNPPSKGRKRKSKDPQEASSSGRKSSTKSNPVVDSAPNAVEAQTKPALELWYEHRTAFQNLAQGITEFDEPNFLQDMKEAETHMTAMRRIYSELIQARNAEILQGPYRRSFQQSG